MMSVVTRGRRPGRAWTTVSRGAHRLTDAEDPWLATLQAWSGVLTSTAVFTHLSAARVHRLWLPPLPADLPVIVGMREGTAPSQRRGLLVSRHRQTPDHTRDLGIRLATVPETLLAAARHLELLDLVVLIDSALHLKRCTLEELWSHARLQRRGAPRLRRALTLADGRSESPYESLLRLLHVLCEVEVEPQYDVCDGGRFVGRADLWLVGTQRLHEYDGGDHLERPQQRHDLKRLGRLDSTGWSRRGFTRKDVLHQGPVILRAADEALGRSFEPARIRPWHAALRRSLFTPSGTELVRIRLGLPPSQHPEEPGQ